MWVHFNLLCGRETQQRLHNIFRHKINDWEKQGLVKGAVLTYHFGVPKATDTLYVCLNIPAVKTPDDRNIKLSRETVEQIPSQILNSIKQDCSENQVKLEIKDYELALQKQKTMSESHGKPYYRGAPVEEILRFASIGTKIAVQILDLVETSERPWISDKELASFILSQLKMELGESYFWLPESFHFVCNPLLLNDSYLWTLAHADIGKQAVALLYSKHKPQENR